MRLGTALGCISAGALFAAAALLAPNSPSASAQAVCDEEAPEAGDLITIVSPALTESGYGGAAPIDLVIHIAAGLAVFPTASLSSEFRWGDGTSSAVVDLPCPDGESAYWPDQDLAHTYTVPGSYTATWHFDIGGQVYDIPFVQMMVVAPPAPPTPTPTPPPAATTTAAPGGGTVAASPSPSETGSPTSTASGSTTPPRTATPTPSAVVAGGAVSTPSGEASPDIGGARTPVPNEEYRPQNFLPIEPITDVSREPDVLATNLVIAGVTVWVLFTSVLLNQVLQGNRAQIDQGTARVTGPLRRARARVRVPSSRTVPGWIGKIAGPAIVLLLTGLIYSVLEPGFGFNEQTAVLFGSAVVGVGLVTYLASGIESMSLRRIAGAKASVRAYPAGIAIAAGSVVVSRGLDLQPGVMYGFVASAAVVGGTRLGSRESGRVALAPVIVALAVAVCAWLLVGPIRELNESRSGWLPALLEASVIVIFIGGIEGIVISMLPLGETDGGKIYHWNRWLWLAIALIAAFLTWHVLLGRERAYFSGLREATSVTVLAIFLIYTALTAAAWAYFRFHGREPVESAESVEPAPGPSTAG